MLAEVRAKGSDVFAITSQSQKKADAAKASWDLGFEVHSDEEHSLADHVRSLGYAGFLVLIYFALNHNCLLQLH